MTRRSVYWSVLIVSATAAMAGTIGGATGIILCALTVVLVLILWSRYAV